MWNVINLFWLCTEDKDLHPPAPELPGVALHWILRFAICDDHQHFGKILPGAGRLIESVFKDEVEGIAWSKETGRREVLSNTSILNHVIGNKVVVVIIIQ